MAMGPQVVRFLVSTYFHIPSNVLTTFHITLFVALGSITYGYCSGIIATTLGQPSFSSYFELAARSNASDLIGTILGLFQAGGFFGALACMQFADTFGRRKALFVAAVVVVVGGALQAGSVHIAMYIATRFITGIGVGALVTLVPLYQSEIAPPKIRGLLVGMHGVLICVGYTMASWVGVGFFFVNASGAQWRVPLAIQCLPPLLLALGILFLPETPRWLINKHRHEDAYKAFLACRAESLEVDEAMSQEFNKLCQDIEVENAHSPKLLHFFTKPALRKRLIIGWLTMFGGQGTATIVINNYSASLCAALGYGPLQQLLLQAGLVTLCPLGNWVCALLVDRIGRTRMLMTGFAGCVIALVGECITVSIFQRTGNRGVASAAIFFLYMHFATYSSTVDATSYVYCSEIFPTPARAKGLAMSVTGLFIATIIFLQAAPTAFADIGWKYYLLFICITTILFFVIWLYFPETKGRSLEDMGELFGDQGHEIPRESEVVHEIQKAANFRKLEDLAEQK